MTIKLLLTLTIGAVLIDFACFAQDDEDDNRLPKAGIKGGINLANLRVDEVGIIT